MSHCDKYPYPSSWTGGVRPLSIRGVYEDERSRISEEFTDEERMWRKQWYKDQILAPDEPRHVPELEKLTKNPIRRFLSAPWKALESQMTPIVGAGVSSAFRFMVPKALVAVGFVYFAWYQLKYHQNDWTRFGGWHLTTNKPTFVPGDKGFPKPRTHFKPEDYEKSLGFQNRTVFRDL